MDKKVVGLLGGGQLGRMFVEAANRLNIQVNILDAAKSPAKQISSHEGHFEGSFKDPEAIEKLSKTCDVVTVEIEHVDTQILEKISSQVAVEPSWKTIRMIQDKYAQKEHLQEYNVATAQSIPLAGATTEDLEKVGEHIGFPFMLKSRTEAYDGRGNFPVKSSADFDAALKALGSRPLYAEKWANFKAELAVMVVKTKDGVLAYPTVETVHEDSICKLVYAPARNVSKKVLEQAQELAKKAVACFWGKGVFGVEMFLLDDDSLLINEIAPRPHNSGHYTIEACPISQYDAHLRSILDIPIQQSELRIREPSIMLNILGASTPESAVQIAERSIAAGVGASIHLYGKGDSRANRKMGHMTLTAPTMREAEKAMQPLLDITDDVRGRKSKPLSDSKPAGQAKDAVVGVIMGSHSDMPVLQAGINILKTLNIPFETHITSAHRTPDWMSEYVHGAMPRGIQVLIAAAGGAAHLPGMAASHTAIPVIGVPVKPTIGDGTDSVLSILNMPRGVPVATVGVNNSTNAALLAARIVGLKEGQIQKALIEYADKSTAEVMEREAAMNEQGWDAVFEQWHGAAKK
ncbi:phosphoribosylaminoimidazole carboxylase [Aureobasidium pullulans]|uniref:Phosphoribosylaminoimidazole carboxylase n=1 Tax=Aureobasidium pullulans TaxID=5580 RepID=A0A4T0BPF9_AURPU|nr:phosphoribosylaminoimidazole carboxylase [Aureobasidium pullulans]THY21512.1 phosphoribosylaminoimidazole carboxylase [Aureobasidium pullulans]THY48798.1 phosphoribosylaminoimidazole carboxylase [Aureobasidium pullulans]THY91504.1 phosphoribosylaminoimidazole carboxylase [Aureobasidium pullulans]THZ70500.1 phosphoribosylaminoimidazole carboxylase [Aureobasidium pullulans]